MNSSFMRPHSSHASVILIYTLGHFVLLNLMKSLPCFFPSSFRSFMDASRLLNYFIRRLERRHLILAPVLLLHLTFWIYKLIRRPPTFRPLSSHSSWILLSAVQTWLSGDHVVGVMELSLVPLPLHQLETFWRLLRVYEWHQHSTED